MKSSKYNLYIPVKAKYVVYNTFTGSLIFIDKEMKAALETNQLKALDDTEKDQLKTHGIIVDDHADESLMYDYVFTKEMYSPSYTSVTIFPTYACNLSCHYCFQRWSDTAKASMTEHVLKNTVEFLKKRITEDHSRSLLIKVFGGEPLVHPGATEAILAGLHQWAETQNIQFFGTLTTNGTLFRGELFERLSPHISAVHITLDGPKELHNSIRYYSHGKGTYEDIMESLELLSRTSIHVCLRINIHDGDYKTTAFLLEDLKERGFSNNTNFELDFGLVIPKDQCGLHLNVETYINNKGVVIASAQYIEDMLKKIGWENIQGVRYPDNIRMDTAPVMCDQTKRKRYIIDALGDLYLCPSKAGDRTYRVGSIGEHGEATWEQGFYDILTRNPLHFAECTSCVYLPVCGGGCAVHAREQNGSYNTSFCGAVKHITSKRVLSYLERYYPEKMGGV
jgi:uncharacterized protein